MPGDLAARLPEGSYRFTSPIERSGLSFARVCHATASAPFEAGITPADDIMSLHLTSFDARTWRNGKVRHDGSIQRRSLSLVNAGVQSDVRLEGQIDIIQVFLPPRFLAEIAVEILASPAQPVIDGWIFDDRLAALTMRAFRASMSRHPAARPAADCLNLALAEHMVRHHSDQRSLNKDGEPRHGGIPPRRMRQLIDFIEQNIAAELTLGELAGLVQLSPFYFLRAFQLETGLTPHHWIMRRRIARAKELLANSDLALAEIAAEVGYASQSGFTTAFSRIVGRSPGEWRRAAKR